MKKKVLLVNSTRHFFADGNSLLDRSDFQVLQAPNADQALLMHRQERVDLIVSDLALPGTGGDVLCIKIRDIAELRGVSIILVCHDTPEERARAARSSANVCLFRPFPASELLAQVEKLLAVAVRKGYRVLLRAKVQGAVNDEVFFCTSLDISSSGILIEVDRPLAVGDRINCSFYLPGAEHIAVAGEVVRKVAGEDRNAYGVRFIGTSTAQQAIDRFIAASS